MASLYCFTSNELRLLREIDEISGVSGGAIVAGRLAAAWPRLRFRIGAATNLWDALAAPLLAFASRRVDVRAVTRALVPGVSVGTDAARSCPGVESEPIPVQARRPRRRRASVYRS